VVVLTDHLSNRVLWYLENHFHDELTLDAVARASGVSRFHLSRAFGYATGFSVMQYVRARRLSEAARALAAGAPDILTVALDAGYNSHEAFTRAFRDQFEVTPESVRDGGSFSNLTLQEPLKMNEATLETLAPPRMVGGQTLLIAGLCERYNAQSSAGIPAQWQRFVPHMGHIPGEVPGATYGVLCNGDDQGNTDYISGVEVSDFSRVPREFARIRIPEQTYAVFTHREHISTIRQVWNTIWNKWLPESGHKLADGPAFERYGREFDPVSGNGGFEIWIPVEN
jgi:AraC family transcriptional regulator